MATRRLPACRDDRGSLAMALLATLVGAMLGALIVPIVLAQNDSTRFDMSRVRSLHAAQAGVDVMLGEIRSRSGRRTASGDLTGNPQKLPCYAGTVSAPALEGKANGTGDAGYQVTVSYFTDAPRTGSRPMICLPTYGTYDPDKQSATPRFAVITSKGTDRTDRGTPRVRTLVSTYVFRTSDSNIPGGQIRLFPLGGDPTNAAGRWCMEAAEPADGLTRVVLGLCSSSTPPKVEQMFAYRDDLSIQLVSSVGQPGHLSGLCIDTRDSELHKPGDDIVLKDCGVANTVDCKDPGGCSTYNQQWSIDDNAHLRGARADAKNTDGFCIDAADQAAGTPLTLQDCSGGIDSPRQTWVPSPTAGAGMAGATNDQLVNYREFATCLDVTEQNKDKDFLILYSCKQNPDPAKVLWNQKFTPSPALEALPDRKLRLLKTLPPGSGDYCLTSPLTAGSSVRVTPCPAGALEGTAYSWTVNRDRLDDKNGLPYAQKFTIVDAKGLCLSPGPATNRYLQYLKVTVDTCDGSTGQKWNADPSLDAARLTNIHEQAKP